MTYSPQVMNYVGGAPLDLDIEKTLPKRMTGQMNAFKTPASLKYWVLLLNFSCSNVDMNLSSRLELP